MSSSKNYRCREGSNLTVTYKRERLFDEILENKQFYLGCCQPNEDDVSIWDSLIGRFVRKRVTFCPGIVAMFDHYLHDLFGQKERSISELRIELDRRNASISICDNGRSIPIVRHMEKYRYLPELQYESCWTSPNFFVGEKCVLKEVNGDEMHGIAPKLVNVFSSSLQIEIASSGQLYKKAYNNSTRVFDQPSITPTDLRDFTKITFAPDPSMFKHLNEGTFKMLHRRAADLAASIDGVSVFVNGSKLPICNFDQYVNFFAPFPDQCFVGLNSTNLKIALLSSNDEEKIGRAHV